MTVPAGPETLEHGFITYTHRPAGAQTLFLLVPGLTGNARQWEGVAAALVADGRAVAHLPPVLAHPGLAAARPLIEDVALAAAQELRDSGWRHVVVLAHSVGSFVGFSLAARLPEQVAGVVAVNGGLYSVGRFLDDPVRGLLRRPGSTLAALRLFALGAVPAPPFVRELVLRHPWLFRLVAGTLVTPEAARSEQSRRVLAHPTAPAGLLPGLWANRHHWAVFRAEATLATCPVVVVTGTLDPLSSEEDSHQMAALFPAGSVVLLEGVGHAATVEAPGVLVDIALGLAVPAREAAADRVSQA